MAANWNLPTLSDTYSNFITYLDARLDDLAIGLDTAATYLPTGSIRYSATNSRWEKYNGSTWSLLADTFAINVSTAGTWTTPRNLTISGDATATHTGVNGSANVNAALTLATVNANVGSFGSSTSVPVLTVNAKGLITGVTTAALASMATQAADNVAITGGSISGITAFTIPSGAGVITEGLIQWNTTNDLLTIGTGAATKTFVDLDSTQTLSNKSVATLADTNFSTSIANAAFVKSHFSSSTATNVDWNTLTSIGINDSLNIGTATNGPGSANYFHPFVVSYSNLDGTNTATNLTQMAISYGSPGNELYMRGRYNNAWSGWVRFLNTSNYTSYVPTLTGTGASGTWGINITGSAGASNAANALWYSAALAGSTTSGNVASMQVRNNGGTGDGAVAAIAYLASGYYGIHHYVRHDGYFGLGGWSRGAWSWYSDPSGNMVASGNVTAYSDPRLKDNVEVIKDPFALLDVMDGVTFNWNERSKLIKDKWNKRDYGILADQVKSVMPEIVTQGINDEETGEIYDTVCYEKLVPVLIEAVKQLRKEINGLTN